jgi:hypothetical protein
VVVLLVRLEEVAQVGAIEAAAFIFDFYACAFIRHSPPDTDGPPEAGVFDRVLDEIGYSGEQQILIRFDVERGVDFDPQLLILDSCLHFGGDHDLIHELEERRGFLVHLRIDTESDFGQRTIYQFLNALQGFVQDLPSASRKADRAVLDQAQRHVHDVERVAQLMGQKSEVFGLPRRVALGALCLERRDRTRNRGIQALIQFSELIGVDRDFFSRGRVR